VVSILALVTKGLWVQFHPPTLKLIYSLKYLFDSDSIITIIIIKTQTPPPFSLIWVAV
jgi:hypothetical protein